MPRSNKKVSAVPRGAAPPQSAGRGKETAQSRNLKPSAGTVGGAAAKTDLRSYRLEILQLEPCALRKRGGDDDDYFKGGQVCALLALPDHALVVAGGCTVSAYDMRSLEALQDGPVDLLASLVRCPVCERLLDPPCSKPNEPDVKENAVLTLERKGEPGFWTPRLVCPSCLLSLVNEQPVPWSSLSALPEQRLLPPLEDTPFDIDEMSRVLGLGACLGSAAVSAPLTDLLGAWFATGLHDSLALTMDTPPPVTKAVKACANPSCSTGVFAGLQCSRCKAVSYCSKDCQALHWKAHKKSCKCSAKL